MWTDTNTDYESVLLDFQTRFNNNERARKLVKGWDRVVLLSATDTGSRFGLLIADQELTAVRPMPEYDEEEDDLVQLEAEEEVLKEIFSGVYNPATALVDGALSVFSHERDKVKLEAIAMVVWRIG